MKRYQDIVSNVWDKLLVTFGVLIVLLPTSPLVMPLTNRDSGVFLYLGWRILNGELPYRDVWDHKPPIIFYINALGLSLTSFSRWGVWLIELLALLLAGYISYRLIRKAFGTLPAVFSLFLWLLTCFFLLQGGNLTNEYILPLQFVCLWLAYDTKSTPFSFHKWLLIGLSGSIAFFTKQTGVGIWIATFAYLTICRVTSHQISQWIREVAMLAIGCITVFIVIVIFFYIRGGLSQFWSAAFVYNFVYSTSITAFTARFRPVILGILPLAKTGLLQISVIGYLIGLILVLSKKNILGDWSSLLLISLIDLPIELILVSLTGRTHAHYYIALLPVLSIFSGVTYWALLLQLSSWEITNVLKYLFFTGTIVAFAWISLYAYWKQVKDYRNNNNYANVIDYIRTTTTSNDYVLLWGAEASSNYFAQRCSPSRFVYQYPLYTPGYTDEFMILEFLEDIIQNKPRLIINAFDTNTPIFDFPIKTDRVQADVAHIRSQYSIEGTLGNWLVYKYTASSSTP